MIHLDIFHREMTYGHFLEGGMLIVGFCLSTDRANGGGGGGWIFFRVIPKYRLRIHTGIVCGLMVVVVVISNYFF